MIARAPYALLALLAACGLAHQDLGNNLDGASPSDDAALGDAGGDATGATDASLTDGADLVGVVQLALGYQHTCARQDNGEVLCLGRNQYGQLGCSSDDLVLSCGPGGAETCTRFASELLDVDDAIGLAVGGDTTCVLRPAGVECLGRNAFGTLARGGVPDLDAHPEHLAADLDGALEIALGRHHGCARFAGGAIRCWGLGHRGQLGVAPASPSLAACDIPPDLVDELGAAPLPCTTTPLDVDGAPTDGAALALAGDVSCVLRAGGEAWCWGGDDVGQLGTGADGPDTETPAPVLATGLDDLGVGGRHGCARDAAADVYCWGADDLGQLGLGTDAPDTCGAVPCRPTPTLLTTLAPATAIATGAAHACALLATTEVACWGSGLDGRLGLEEGATDDCGGTPCETAPNLTHDLDDVVELVTGDGHTCARVASGDVRCWGRNDFHQSGGNTDYLGGVPIPSTIYGFD